MKIFRSIRGDSGMVGIVAVATKWTQALLGECLTLALFYIILTPVGLVLRWTGDPLECNLDPKRESYWEQPMRAAKVRCVSVATPHPLLSRLYGVHGSSERGGG